MHRFRLGLLTGRVGPSLKRTRTDSVRAWSGELEVFVAVSNFRNTKNRWANEGAVRNEEGRARTTANNPASARYCVQDVQVTLCEHARLLTPLFCAVIAECDEGEIPNEGRRRKCARMRLDVKLQLLHQG
ncbi:conserved hypothetical protein [Histoplasma capsulatum var. duboisii H88]|uniref:Uncharacterized protein n=1 Tax=Ajellomyces capsulatus (strain H88) TaxID=544711 RepID=F0UJQ8_AJEC8|nr:conserved hypothetical protein [Histoplasma capsulatum var. duboisii H88]